MKAALSRNVGESVLVETMPLADVPPVAMAPGVVLLERLEGLCADRGLSGLAGRLEEMAQLVGGDLASFEMEFAALPRRPQLVGQSARHLVDLGGKRLRPLVLCLAARQGWADSGLQKGADRPLDRRVLDLAVAVELVHSATLLHDDVVDGSETRRGAATARALYGNAASIFAGDWLLVEALRRVQSSALPGLLEGLFDTIEEMIFAESIQLENRGRLSLDRAGYFRVVEGKTASVFRWATVAGAQAAGLPAEQRQALATYGENVGVAFQAVDDLLDLTGDTRKTGKHLFADLREGKMTYPLIVALERRPELRPLLEQIAAQGVDGEVDEASAARVIAALRETRAVEDCLALARERSFRATEALSALPDGHARRALATVAEAIIDREI
jgi:octaprenyl-diphosphate synthase